MVHCVRTERCVYLQTCTAYSERPSNLSMGGATGRCGGHCPLHFLDQGYRRYNENDLTGE
jgi:hypothetical protein